MCYRFEVQHNRRRDLNYLELTMAISNLANALRRSWGKAEVLFCNLIDSLMRKTKTCQVFPSRRQTNIQYPQSPWASWQPRIAPWTDTDFLNFIVKWQNKWAASKSLNSCEEMCLSAMGLFSSSYSLCSNREVLSSLPNSSFQVTKSKNTLWDLKFILKWLKTLA